MMFKYIKAFFKGLYKVVFAYPKICRYAKNKDKYSFEVRYAFLRKLIKIVFDSFDVKVNIEGFEKLNNKSCLFVSNHQGVMDALTMIYLCDRPMTFVCKIEAMKYPVISKACQMIDVIFFDRDNIRDAVKMVKLTKNYLSSGLNVMIFPEGTRTKDENYMPGEYKAGALKPAFETKSDIATFCMDGSYKVFSKKYTTNIHVDVSLLDVLSYEKYKDENTSELAVKIQGKTKEKLTEIRKQ